MNKFLALLITATILLWGVFLFKMSNKVLDAILPGDKPVAILKYRGESAVVCVGQEIWDVVVVAIEADHVTLKYEGETFTVR